MGDPGPARRRVDSWARLSPTASGRARDAAPRRPHIPGAPGTWTAASFSLAYILPGRRKCSSNQRCQQSALTTCCLTHLLDQVPPDTLRVHLLLPRGVPRAHLPACRRARCTLRPPATLLLPDLVAFSREPSHSTATGRLAPPTVSQRPPFSSLVIAPPDSSLCPISGIRSGSCPTAPPSDVARPTRDKIKRVPRSSFGAWGCGCAVRTASLNSHFLGRSRTR